jgi:formylglycine-generating enzyme
MKKLFSMLTVVLALCASAFAAPVSLVGKVTDTTTGAALDGVIVKLAKQAALVDTTDTTGRFLLSGTTVNILGGIVSRTGSVIKCVGENVHFTVKQPTRVSVEAFSTAGRLLARPFDKLVAPGAYRVPVGLGFATQIVFIRITCGSDVHVFRMRGAMSHGKSQIKYDDMSAKQAPLFKVAAAAAVDTLVFSHSGFSSKMVVIAAYTMTDSIRIALKPMPLPRVMRKISGGTFSMGTAGAADTVHSVTVSSFYIDTTEVTQADYKTVMGKNPALHSNNLKKPVESVTWFDAVLYCNALSKRYGFDTAYTFSSRHDTSTGACLDLGGIAVDIKKKGYRLPTSAEWEFAIRGGKATKFFWGSDSSTDTISKYAVFLGNVTADSTPQPTATKKPNAYGLYDMSGNVWEWCTDQWSATYGSAAQTDPCVLVAPAGTVNLKGGDYLDPPSTIASGFHTGAKTKATTKLPFFGFRVVIPPMYSDSELSYMTIVGATIAAAKDSAINAWYNTVHIPLLFGYDSLKAAYRYKKTVAIIDTTLPGYFATYHYASKAGMQGMGTSTAFDTAIKNMSATWSNTDFATNLAVNYQKIMSIEKPGSVTPTIMQIVGAEIAPGSDAAVNEWYDNTHLPLFMRFGGLVKVARYKKLGGADTTADINQSKLPTYLAVYYYPTQADADAMQTSSIFAAAIENQNDVWKNNELTLKFVLFSKYIFTKKR